MLKLCENGSNIDYLYETNSVLRKPKENRNFGFDLLASVRFRFLKTEQKFGFRTSLGMRLMSVYFKFGKSGSTYLD